MRASKRSLLVPFVAAVGAVLATGAVAWACTMDSWITIDPTSGIPGATVQVDGGSFVNGEVHLYWDSTTSSSHLKSVDTDQASQGEDSPGDSGFSTTVDIPEDARAGDHAIVARSSPDGDGKRYNASASFKVVADDSPSQSSGDGSEDTSGDSSNTSDQSPQTSGDSGEETSTEETSSSPSQSTSGTTSQEASGQTAQGSSGETAEPNAIPPSQRQPERPRDAAEAEDTGSPDSAAPTPAEDDPANQGGQETPPQAQERQTVGESSDRQTVGQTPSPAPSAAQAPDDEAGSAAAPTPDASEQSGEPPVTDESVGAEQEQGSQPTQAEEPAAADSERTAGFSVPEAMRIGPDGATARTPSTGSASGDLWRGLQDGDTPSLTPDAAVEEESATEGMSGALTAGVAMLALGSILLLGGVGATAARRRRQPATASSRGGRQR